jgi:hypothetical protein
MTDPSARPLAGAAADCNVLAAIWMPEAGARTCVCRVPSEYSEGGNLLSTRVSTVAAIFVMW